MSATSDDAVDLAATLMREGAYVLDAARAAASRYAVDPKAVHQALSARGGRARKRAIRAPVPAVTSDQPHTRRRPTQAWWAL